MTIWMVVAIVYFVGLCTVAWWYGDWVMRSGRDPETWVPLGIIFCWPLCIIVYLVVKINMTDQAKRLLESAKNLYWKIGRSLMP